MIKSILNIAKALCFLLALLFLGTAPSMAASTTFLATDDNGWPVQALALGTVTKVSYTGTAGTGPIFDKTKGSVIVRVVCTTDCHVICNSAAPTATSSHTLLPALVPEYFRVPAANTCSFVRNATSGDAFITEMD